MDMAEIWILDITSSTNDAGSPIKFEVQTTNDGKVQVVLSFWLKIIALKG